MVWQQWAGRTVRRGCGLRTVLPIVCSYPLQAMVIDAPDWLRQVGIPEQGVLLVRPDQIIAWRAQTTPSDPADGLTRVLARILTRTGTYPTWLFRIGALGASP
ncbi:hypothetical protein ACQP1G_06655 [Nocardia sp. CA-107356]|uniref:aromatic-ring hydroxylase C-terminal domain-containing protein n=1 Tax=Nocardia sp. CA-107356 TaxID=3239972 RepID=UPI003D8CECDF